MNGSFLVKMKVKNRVIYRYDNINLSSLYKNQMRNYGSLNINTNIEKNLSSDFLIKNVDSMV